MKENNTGDVLKKLYGVIFVVLTGIFIGTFLSAYLVSNKYCFSLSDSFLIDGQAVLSVISLLVLLFIFFFGLSAFGQPIILLFTLLFGIVSGFYMSDTYVKYGLSAFKINGTLVLPFLTLYSVCFVLSAADSLRMSGVISSLLVCEGELNGKREVFKLYYLRFVIYAFIMLASLALRYLMIYLFSKTVL